MSSVKLYCAWSCPFAQRAWIALLEKGVNFDYIETDPYQKTPELLAKNPRGLVPIIENEGKIVYDSPVCIEYVDEAFETGKHLMPKDPYERAKCRIWSDFISKKIVPFYYQMLVKDDESDREDAKEMIRKSMIELSLEMDSEGPFFGGKTFGLVDIMLVPYTIRLCVLKHYRSFELPEDSSFDRIRKWMKSAHAHESVIKTRAKEADLIDYYKRYADNIIDSQVANAVRKGIGLP